LIITKCAHTFYILSLTVLYLGALMTDLSLDLALNLLAEAIGITVTIFLINRLIRTREERKIVPVRDALLDRIFTHCRLLTTWVEFIAYEKGKISNVLTDSIKESKDALMESIVVGDAIISPVMQEAVLSLDGKIEVLLKSSDIREFFPDEEWAKGIDETLSQLKTIFDLLGKDFDSVVLESWLNVFRKSPYVNAESTKVKKPKRKKKSSRVRKE